MDDFDVALGNSLANLKCTASRNLIGLLSMRDTDIRHLLRTHLVDLFGTESRALVLEEFGLCCGRVRADLAVVNGQLKGFEIKSDFDSLRRLARQVEVYGRVFDTATIVVGERFVEQVDRLVPNWWGIMLAASSHNKEIPLQQVRSESQNLGIDPNALVQLLWKDEALSCLRLHNLHHGLQKKPRKFAWDAIVRNFDIAAIQNVVRSTLKARCCCLADQ